MPVQPQEGDTNTNDDDREHDDRKVAAPLLCPSPSPCPPPSHERDDALLEPYRYIDSVPGKNVRGKLIDCFQLWLEVPTTTSPSSDRPDVLSAVKRIVGDLHNASLLIDDIEDNSKLRRGVPVAHSIFGVAPVINCANYVYFLALERCRDLRSADVMDVFVSELLNLHRGQGQDIHWRDSGRCPTEEEYCAMVTDKTGGLFRLAVGLLQSFATRNRRTDFTPLVDSLALYFQIRDDLINLADPEYMKSKSFCEDLTEGKFSFPIIHCVRAEREVGDSRLLSILKQRTDDVDVKRYAQRLLRDAGSLEYTREKCASLKGRIVCLVEELGGNDSLLGLIELLDVQIGRLGDATAVGGGGGSGIEVDGEGVGYDSLPATPRDLLPPHGAHEEQGPSSRRGNDESKATVRIDEL